MKKFIQALLRLILETFLYIPLAFSIIVIVIQIVFPSFIPKITLTPVLFGIVFVSFIFIAYAILSYSDNPMHYKYASSKLKIGAAIFVIPFIIMFMYTYKYLSTTQSLSTALNPLTVLNWELALNIFILFVTAIFLLFDGYSDFLSTIEFIVNQTHAIMKSEKSTFLKSQMHIYIKSSIVGFLIPLFLVFFLVINDISRTSMEIFTISNPLIIDIYINFNFLLGGFLFPISTWLFFCMITSTDSSRIIDKLVKSEPGNYMIWYEYQKQKPIYKKQTSERIVFSITLIFLTVVQIPLMANIGEFMVIPFLTTLFGAIIGYFVIKKILTFIISG